MIIQCEKCQTRFRLDDSRVSDKGVKVRCTKCKHVFRVHREAPEADLFAVDTKTDSIFPDAVSTEPSEETAEFTEPFDSSLFDTSSLTESSFDFESNEPELTTSSNLQTESVTPSATVDDIDFSSFDFGESDSDQDQTPASTVSVDDFTDTGLDAAPVTAKPAAAPQGLDFSDDEMFGAVVENKADAANDVIAFDFSDDSFAESMDAGNQDSGGKGNSAFSLETSTEAPFSLSEIDFGDELTSVAVQQVNPDDLKPSQQILFAPMAETQTAAPEDHFKPSFQLDEAASEEHDELPPLSISSRRKKSPVFAVVMTVIMVSVLSFIGYLAYTSFYPSKESGAQESGKIDVSGVTATYVDNDDAGELLVISGEAVNNYAKPRAGLQVKVTVFDANGLTIATKNAYCGNPLTEEQLESMPLDKIETAMANQFGDSLTNMEVAPGDDIPFVVVLSKLPKGAKDYAVQPIGSTVAAGKHD